jgi:2-dehydro-3-deoxygalactonokinase
MNNVNATWVAVDWGTTNIRIWAIDSSDNVIAYSESDEGMKDLQQNEFEPVLLNLIGNWLDGDRVTPVIACGMVGARQGWLETPYQKAPCVPINIKKLTVVSTTDARIQVNVIPGIKQHYPADIMRGEETQIAGFLKVNPEFDGIVCLPGTHIKWAKVSKYKVEKFTTFMTGELFDVISVNTLLSHSIGDNGWHQSSFEKGIMNGFKNPSLIAAETFSLRAESILNGVDSKNTRSKLSGLLIGIELHATKNYWQGNKVIIIGSEVLIKHYSKALQLVGGESDSFNAEVATLAGLRYAYNELHTNYKTND